MAAEVPPSESASQQNNGLKRKSKERNWTEEEIEALIGLYEERVCLWDVGNGDYMNRDSKELAYSQIDEEMKKHDIEREEYKYKWKILRSQFMREKEAERKKKSGRGANEVYSSKWKWFSNLKYLTTIDANVSNTKGYDTMKKVPTIEIGEDNDEPAVAKTPKKMKAEVEKQRMFILGKAVQVLNGPTETSEPKQLSLNEDEHFGMFVAKSIARLSGRKKVLTQKKISDILFESELQGDQESGQFIDLSYNHFRSGDHYLPGFQQTLYP